MDAPVVAAARDRLPLAAVLDDLDDAVAVRRHFDVGLLPVERRLLVDAGEHQMLVGVFVIDAEETVRPVARTGRQRQVADVVAVVAELLRLRLRRLVVRVERRRIGEDGIAPADEDVGGVAGRDVMGLVIDMRDFGKGERGVRGIGERPAADAGRGERSDGGGTREPGEDAATRQINVGDRGKRRVAAVVRRNIVVVHEVEFLEKLGVPRSENFTRDVAMRHVSAPAIGCVGLPD